MPSSRWSIRNLVHNALKFTDVGTVSVRAEMGSGSDVLVIVVADTGIGISPEGQGIISTCSGRSTAAIGGGTMAWGSAFTSFVD